MVWGYPTDQLLIWRSMQVVTQCDLPAAVTVGVSPMHLHRFQQLLSGVGPHGRLIHCSGQPGIAGHGWLRWHRVARPWGGGWPEQHWRWAPDCHYVPLLRDLTAGTCTVHVHVYILGYMDCYSHVNVHVHACSCVCPCTVE